MDLAAKRQLRTVRLRRLAAELRNLRRHAGLTREQVSDHTAINEATLYRIETAKVRPQRRTLLTLLDQYGVTDEARRADLIELSKQSTQRGWLQTYETELPEEYTNYISFEADAKGCRTYESLFLPGQLQTERYARAVIHGVLPAATDQEVELRVRARMDRQSLLTKETPLRLWAVIDEAALHRAVGGPEVMTEQLRHIVEVAKAPNITVQVIPFGAGAHPGMPGQFILLEFDDPLDADIIYIDSMAGDLFLESETDIARYRMIFDNLVAVALSPRTSVALVAELATTMEAQRG